MTAVFILLATAFGIVFGPTFSDRGTVHQPVGEPAYFCAWMFVDGCPFGDHVLQGPAPNGYSGLEAHGDCRTCVPGYPCHSGCNPEEEEDLDLAYGAALEAASRGDVTAVLALDGAVGRYVEVNGSRNAVQVFSCDGATVVANLPIGSEHEM